MFNYALLDDNKVCHSVYQSSDERTDNSADIISIPEYDNKYLNAVWTGSKWLYQPSPEHNWNGSEWIQTDFSGSSSLSPEDRVIIDEITDAVLKEYRDTESDLEDPAVEAEAVEEAKRRFKEKTGREFGT